MGSSQSDDCDTRDSQPVEDTILTNLTNKSFREEQNAKGPQNKAKSRLGIRAEANGLNHGTLSTLAGPSTASLGGHSSRRSHESFYKIVKQTGG